MSNDYCLKHDSFTCGCRPDERAGGFGLKGNDEHGQPLNRNFGARRLTHRTIDELIGLCKGVQADGVVHPDEAVFLSKWLESSLEVIDTWPANILAARIEKIFEDGKPDEEERKDLFELLSDITGYKPGRTVIDEETGEVFDNFTRASTLLPLDKPAPTVLFESKVFCFTGKFFYGGRKTCENEVMARGGHVHPTVNKKVDYLVIGQVGSTDWKHSTHGNKIEAAIQIKNKGGNLAIISEKLGRVFDLLTLDNP